MQRFENWMSYSFDDVEYADKTSETQSFKINFNKKVKLPLPSLTEALYNNARLMRDMYSEPFDVLLSGGTDSEVMVRVFKDLKIRHNTFIFRCEEDLNRVDVINAVDLCEELNIDYKIIDFNVRHFFENEAYDVVKSTFTTCVWRLPRIKWWDYLDNIPVMGQGEPYFSRELKSDYTKKSRWLCPFDETVIHDSIVAQRLKRIVIADWFEYTPQILLSSMQHPVFKALLNDEVHGKQGTWSSRYKIYKDIWPTMKFKPKLTGYESGGDPHTYPAYIDDFIKNNGGEMKGKEFNSTPEELHNLLIDYD